jgi:hypothetical protein
MIWWRPVTGPSSIMSILSWNCRRLENPHTVRGLCFFGKGKETHFGFPRGNQNVE